MKAEVIITHENRQYSCDLLKPLDLSIPLEPGAGHVSAWYVDPVKMDPVRNENWIGSVKEGGSVNFRNVFFNPHGHGTHTESYGHISEDIYSVNDALRQYFYFAQVISVIPVQMNGDSIITIQQLEAVINGNPQALVIRTLPNENSKRNRNWSATNPTYLEPGAGVWLRERGVEHLLLDLPSVDREHDDGKLTVHHEFWNFPEAPRKYATITEMIFVDDSIADGIYLLNLQTTAFVNDATPSRPVLFQLAAR